MKAAFILNSFPEISEKFLLNHIIATIQAGIEVEVYAAHRPSTEMRHGIYDEYHVADHVRYVDIPRSVKKRIFQAPGLFFSLLKKNPRAAFESFRFGKYRTVAQNMKLLYFGHAFNGKRYDVIHCHFGVNGLIGCYLKNCGFTGALVTTFHGSDINTYPKKHGLNVYKTLYRTADRITANTTFTKNKIIANGCTESLIRVIPVGLIVKDYKDVDGTKRIPHTLLTVGRLEEKKGHIYALQAVAIVREQFPDTRYFIAGSGSLQKKLADEVTRLDLGNCVKFLGLVNAEEVKKLYASCSVFTLPSVTASNGDMEGQGLVIQEAQMCGLPVVTTRHNGIPDGLIDGITGFLVPEKNPEELAEKIITLFGDNILAEKMGKSGKEFVASKYDVDILTKEFVALYKECIGE